MSPCSKRLQSVYLKGPKHLVSAYTDSKVRAYCDHFNFKAKVYIVMVGGPFGYDAGPQVPA